MNTTERFNNRVESYVRSRPGYPPQIVELMRERMSLQRDSVIADIGSGTGIFARLLLDNGNTVYGVEPNQEMRAAGQRFLCEYSNFTSIEGTAENTGLPDENVDFVVSAQAFHWFKPERAKAEFNRILKSGGWVALLWNVRRTDADGFARAYERFLLDYGTDYRLVQQMHPEEKVLPAFFARNFDTADFFNEQTFDFEGLKNRFLSSSYAPNADHPRHAETIRELERIFDKYQERGKISFFYTTKVYYGQLDD